MWHLAGKPATVHAPTPFKFGVQAHAPAAQTQAPTSGSAPTASPPIPSWPTNPFGFWVPSSAAAPSSQHTEDAVPVISQPAASQPVSGASQATAPQQEQPLQQSNDSTHEQEPVTGQQAASTSGWGSAFLQSNQAAATQATDAAADAAKQGSTASQPAELPAPAASAWGSAFLQSNQSAAARATEAAADAAQEGQPGGSSTTPAPAWGAAALLQGSQAAAGQATQAAEASTGQSAPVVSSWGASFLQGNQAAAAQATEAAADAAKEGASTAQPAESPAPVANGWGAAFLQSNQASAAQVTDAAAQEASKGAGIHATSLRWGDGCPDCLAALLFPSLMMPCASHTLLAVAMILKGSGLCQS